MPENRSEDMTRKRSRKRSKRRRCRQKSEGKLKPTQTARDQWTNAAQIYQSLFEWHHNHVMSLCPENNTNGDQEYGDNTETEGAHCLDYVYESSSDDQEDEPIDEEYLKFLEVTIKHQQELRDLKAAQITTSLD
ncbi:uncharacterized protein LOC128253568 [Drosophila gunungcola]|uniref:Uncharacterized protein n=1 Tax=Drosophila gunungcola TaxID=103775 RepID=A0A9P9YDU5_9MUSC|nr:uncharacterized protein LOC128253568 [Drosophila gunungcola]KAI8034948.1 hypothetical protein M5D96_012295 [Drosophila gunungcola]